MTGVPTRKQKQGAFEAGFHRKKGLLGVGSKKWAFLMYKSQNSGLFGVNLVKFE